MTLEEIEKTFGDHLMRCGVPREIVRKLQDPISETPAVIAVRAWWESGDPVIVLSGGNGCGKSLAAASVICNHRQDNSKIGYINSPGDMLPWWVWKGCFWRDATRIAAFSAFDPEDRAEARSLGSTTLLIVDEAGNESGQGESAIGNLVCDRAGDHRRTILTTNLAPDKFAARYGSRVMSRIGPGGIKVVHGPDLRRA